jgi:Tfp pilus assembly protein PilO
MALETKNKNFVLNMVVILVAVFIAFNFIYKGQEQELQRLVAKKDMEAKKNVVLANISRMEKDIVGYKTLLQKKDAGEAINTINNLARASGIKISSIKPPATEQKTQDYIRSTFDVMLSAPSYHALGKFVSALESYRDVYIVDWVDITSQEPGKELTANLKVSTIVVAE